jgi:hypothetical protein
MMKTKKSSGRRDAGNIGLLIPMYVFTHQLGKQEEFPAKHMLPHRTNQPVQHTDDSDQDEKAANVVK